MKKRIFAILTAIVLVCTAFVLASCKDEIIESSQSSEESQQELSARELFIGSLFKTAMNSNNDENTLSQLSEILFADSAKDQIGKIALDINKLEVEGEDLRSFGKIGLESDLKLDADNQLVSIDYALTFLGETVDASLLSDNVNKKIFITDILDALDKPVLVLDYLADAEESFNLDKEELKAVFDSVINAVSENITDNAFLKTTKNVTVDGKAFNDATVITLVINKETLKNIANAITEAIKDNEKLGELLDDESILSDDEIPESIKIVNTIVDKESIALDIEINLPEDNDEDEDTSGEIDNDFEAETDDDTPEYNKAVINADYVNGNFNLKFGPANDEGKFFDEHGYASISYKLENEKETFVFGGVEDGEEVEFIKLEGTNKNDERKGKLSFYIDGDTLTIDYASKSTDKNGSVEIGPISMTSQNETTEIDFKLTANYSVTDTKIDVNGEIKLSFEDEFKFEMTYSVSTEYKEVTLDNVTDYIEVDDFDESRLEPAFQEKCPNLYQMIVGNNEKLVPYFIDDRFALYLPEGFEEQSVTGYTAVFDSAEVAIFVLEEKFDVLGVELTLDEYLNLVRNNANGSVSEIFDDSLPYFVYENSEFGIHYIVTAYEGEDSFWLVQFCCSEDNFNDYQERFLEWAYDSGVVYFEVVDESF